MAKLGLSMIQSTATYVMQLGTSLALVIIVSRLLSPEEIGAYLIASAVMILVLPLRDFQVPAYVLQRDTIDAASMRPVSFVAWVSAAAALAVVAIAAVILDAAFAGQPIAMCLAIMALSLVVRPLALLPMSLLARELRYGAIATIQTLGAATKIAVTLGLIWQGYGAEALAWGYVAELAVETLAILLVEPAMRLVRPAIAGSRDVIRFAAPFAGANLVLTISMAAIPIIIGGSLGLAASAFFNRARTISQFFRSSVEGAVHQIVLQRFAQCRDDLPGLRIDYARSIVLLTAISWPSLVWLFLLAQPLTLLLFGERWIAAAPLMQGLAVAGFVYSATAFSRQLHAAMEDTALLLRRDAWLQLPLLVAVLAAAQFSTLAVVAAVALVSIFALVVHMWLIDRQLQLRPSDFARSLLPSVLVALVVGLAVGAARAILGADVGQFALILATALVAALSWSLALMLLRHPLLEEMRAFWRAWREGPV